MDDRQPIIMIVDDTPENLKLLDGMLRERGYQVRAFPRGELALNAARQNPPDLILLDIMMPGMDGYEVCERLKADGALKDIPVIFISALGETMDKVKAFGVGGVDYITKPFQFEEVEARVRTHLELQRQKRELQQSYDKLRELERLRDSLVHMIVHDMRTPLTSIRGFLELAAMTPLPEQVAGYIKKALGSVETLIEMVSSLLDVSKMESGELKPKLEKCDVVGIAREVIAQMEGVRGERQLTFTTSEERIEILADAELVRRIMQNLLSNSLKFTPPDGRVVLGLTTDERLLRVTVEDNGPGIPKEYHERIFEKFGQVEMREQQQKHSTGLGLTFCKLAVEAHGGRIGVESDVGQGSTFWFELPRAPATG